MFITHKFRVFSPPLYIYCGTKVPIPYSLDVSNAAVIVIIIILQDTPGSDKLLRLSSCSISVITADATCGTNCFSASLLTEWPASAASKLMDSLSYRLQLCSSFILVSARLDTDLSFNYLGHTRPAGSMQWSQRSLPVKQVH